ncbi:YacL family protein [Dasania sp. GY-MA-18]|uniref:YacL family protein n=1 Tax=Dasania phycosphaerae TaxID=2950436 RepID=A0A9J6RLR3_9GAMM|nr:MULTISPECIES: YacL family protein [Dasania]MCR8923222.1 YacL family protein [Dasania sp. GY-MA-18]MCZ0865654.1 YacL family protein [Dasania phycosphaerae]MCZ0869379.1 YacL family protein [Dasania phycosphaerae]
MDYEFTLDEYDRPIAEFSSGFEALGRWLSEEVSNDEQQIEELLDIITQLEQKRINSRQLFGRDAQLTLSHNEVEAIALALTEDSSYELPEDTQLYNDESEASCGLLDFKEAVLAWQQFINE